jgi:uncharacterized membrane protein
MIKLAYGSLLAFCTAVLVHIAIIFFIPLVSQPRIITQLQTLTQSRDPLILRGDTQIPGLPAFDPFFRYRVCFYDLNDGAFQLISTGEVPFFSAALLSEDNDVSFFITDRQTINGTLNIEVRAASEQQRLSQGPADLSASTAAVPVFVAQSKGYAIVRVFVPDESWSEIGNTFLKNIICQSVETDN